MPHSYWGNLVTNKIVIRTMSYFPVTIAVSVYNVSSYLRATLDSILSQTFSEFELVCIDDASTDGTWEILKDYARLDNRIRLIRQETNQGLSVSRNRAIAEAKGEYLLMLDGDDLFAPDMVEKAYCKAKETGADLVMWDYCVFYQDEELPKLLHKSSLLMSFNLHDKMELLRRPAFMWVKLLRTDKVRELGIHFPEGLTKQDIPVHWKLITSLDRICLIPDCLSFYRQQPGSTSNRKGKSLLSLAYVLDIVKEQLVNDGIYQKYKNVFLYWRITCLFGMYDSINSQFKDEAKKMVIDRLGQDEWNYIRERSNEINFSTRNFYGMIEGNKWATLKYYVFLGCRFIYRLI